MLHEGNCKRMGLGMPLGKTTGLPNRGHLGSSPRRGGTFVQEGLECPQG